MAYNNRGFAYGARASNDRALADYRAGDQARCRLRLAYYNRGNAYYDRRDYDRAIPDLNQAIKLNPNYARAFHDRGVANYDRREYDVATAAPTSHAGNAELFIGDEQLGERL